jgi:hypothetical protein
MKHCDTEMERWRRNETLGGTPAATIESRSGPFGAPQAVQPGHPRLVGDAAATQLDAIENCCFVDEPNSVLASDPFQVSTLPAARREATSAAASLSYGG